MAEQSEMKIAIVEDHPLTAEMLSDLLTATSKCKPLIFYTAKQTLDYFEKQIREAPGELPHLVILDLTLPDKNGLEILRMMRSNALLKDTPVLINTGSDKLEDFAEAKTYNKVFFLKKGVGQFTLNDIITKLKADGILAF